MAAKRGKLWLNPRQSSIASTTTEMNPRQRPCVPKICRIFILEANGGSIDGLQFPG